MNPRTITALAGAAACSLGTLAQPVKKVLVIGIDGLRPDAMEAAFCPNLDQLIADGAYSRLAQCEDLTFSGPNWSTILHGVHRDKHNVTTNDYTGSLLAQWPDFFARLEQTNPAWNTARLTTWDAIYIHQPTGADIDIFRNYTSNGDALIVQDAARLLLRTHPTYNTDIDAMFVYLADVDVAGHQYGFSPTATGYLASIERADTQVGQVLTAMRQRPTFGNEDWLVIVTSDHGGAPDGSHSGGTPEKRTIPFIVSGPSAARGIMFPEGKNLDVARTALAHMGVPVSPAWGLDGHIIGLSPSAPPPLTFDTNVVFNGTAEYDRGFAGVTPDQAISGWFDAGPGGATVIMYDTPGGYPLSTSPGPAQRGANFLGGGTTAESRLIQTIDATSLAAMTDGNWVRFSLAGYLGGYSTQDDRVSLTARFKSAGGAVLGQTVLGPVTAAERGGTTGLLPRQGSGPIPAGTRRVEVELHFIRAAGSENDGYADNIALSFSTTCYANCDGSTIAPVLNVQDFGCFMTSFAAGSDHANCDGSTTPPVHTVSDFACFLNRYAQGCS